MLTKKDFIKLADEIKASNARYDRTGGCGGVYFSTDHVDVIADFCQGQNPNFNRDRFCGYIDGECGSSGGAVKKAS